MATTSATFAADAVREDRHRLEGGPVGYNPLMDSQLSDLRRRAAEYATRDGRVAEDDYFFTEQNARLVKNAEQYYRTMFQGRISSWNLRDRHMAETLDSLMDYFTETT